MSSLKSLPESSLAITRVDESADEAPLASASRFLSSCCNWSHQESSRPLFDQTIVREGRQSRYCCDLAVVVIGGLGCCWFDLVRMQRGAGT